jgi:predicted component of type VI protein secretion system
MTDESRLVMSQGPQPGQTFILDQDLLKIGRDPSNDIVINDAQVSRQHARIRRQGPLLVIEDVGSTNGTFANGVRLTNPHTLTNGDVINLGDAVTLTYHGVDIAVTEPLAGRPTTVSPVPPAYEPQPAPPPAYAAISPTPPDYQPQPTPPPVYAPAYSPAAVPPSAPQPAEEPKSKRWLWVGCGCLVLLLAVACLGVVVLDYFKMLPDIFYEPLRWLGLI